MYNKLHQCDAIKYMELQLEVLEFGSVASVGSVGMITSQNLESGDLGSIGENMLQNCVSHALGEQLLGDQLQLQRPGSADSAPHSESPTCCFAVGDDGGDSGGGGDDASDLSSCGAVSCT